MFYSTENNSSYLSSYKYQTFTTQTTSRMSTPVNCAVRACPFTCAEGATYCDDHGCENCKRSVKFGCKYCTKCKCDVPGCPMAKTGGSAGCLLHACGMCRKKIRIGFPKHRHSFTTTYATGPLENVRQYRSEWSDNDSDFDDSCDDTQVGDYCADCTCKLCKDPICPPLTQDSNGTTSNTCEKHACESCHTKVRMAEYKYCVDCKCYFADCSSPKANHSGGCSQHTCVECNEKVSHTVESHYCSDCKCGYSVEVCESPRIGGKKACENHLCPVCKIMPIEVGKNGRCSNCTCLCCDKQVAKNGVCADHLCKVCQVKPAEKYFVRSYKQTVCEEHLCGWFSSSGCRNSVLNINSKACEEHLCIKCKTEARSTKTIANYNPKTGSWDEPLLCNRCEKA